MNQFYTATDHFVLLPAILLALFGCAVLLIDFLIAPDPKQRKLLLIVVLPGLGFTAFELIRQQQFLNDSGRSMLTAFHGALTLDGTSIFFNWIFLIAALIVILISYKYLEVEDEHHGEYYALILFAQCGMYFLATATELVTILVGLELMAVSFYIMVGFLRKDRRSNEAAMKYLLLGAFSTGFLAYGFSLLYGLAGSTQFDAITAAVKARDPFDPILFLAIATTTVGLMFKIAAVPFHMWAPDAYEGAPTPITAYLSVASKAASFALLLRLFTGPLASARPAWEPILVVIAILTLTVGNLAAISQSNIKRLLAYSAISHAGYILLGLIAGTAIGIQGVAIYIAVYTFMTLGAFLVVVALRRKNLIGEDIADFAGLMQKSPGYAVMMLIFLLSLAGIPPTAGFIGKYYIFLALIQTGKYGLAVFATLYSAVAVYYYFRIVRSMFLADAVDSGRLTESVGVRVSLAFTGLATLAIGIYPQPLIEYAQRTLLK
jgi:NADH-quinone oxidoreductase subunit N